MDSDRGPVVEGIQHVSIGVTDLARSLDFYTRVLGLEQTERPPFDFGGAWLRVGPQQVHLIVRPAAELPGPDAEIMTRRAHFAIRVRSYRETLAHLRALEVPCVDRPQNLTPWPQIYVTDPDGNLIELNAEAVN